MYQKSYLTNVDGIRDNICDMQFLIHNIIQEKIQKYMFILLLNDLWSYMFCG